MRHLVNDPVPRRRPREDDYDPDWERVLQAWAEADAEAELQRERAEAEAYLAAHPVEEMSDEELLAAINPEPEELPVTVIAEPLEPLAPVPDPLTPTRPIRPRTLFRYDPEEE